MARWCPSYGEGPTDPVVAAALVKTQGSDGKLVAQMQPWYEARTLGPTTLGGRSVPPLVTQISDGENGGVMMNEFPPKYVEVVREAKAGDVPLVNGSEYLDHLRSVGVTDGAFIIATGIGLWFATANPFQ